MIRQDQLYDHIRKKESLRKAWAKIYENGKQSESQETQRLVNEFKQNEEGNLKQLTRKLRTKNFDFGTARGVPVKKKNGKLRPIVSASIEARVVQRAILDELSHRKEIKNFFSVPTSFGSIPGKGVPEAIGATALAIQDGAKYYIKSDISDFFINIPRSFVVKKISDFWNDNDFSQLLEKATNIEIENLTTLEHKYGAEFKNKFIFDQTGTPQGCCLSPLIGNVLLYEFDNQMNSQDITCLRYLDDFILLGSTYRNVQRAHRKAQRLLGQHNLETHPGKTIQGSTKEFEFLGVEFRDKLIRPSSASRKRLLASIRETIRAVSAKNNENEKTQNIVNALYYISNRIRGWGNQYKFCNDAPILGSLDSEIAKSIIPYFIKFSKSLEKKDQNTQRRLIGIWSLSDCKKDPIIF